MRGAWVAQWVKHLALDFSSGHGLTVGGIEPRIRMKAHSLLSTLSLSLSLSAPLKFSLSQK